MKFKLLSALILFFLFSLQYCKKDDSDLSSDKKQTLRGVSYGEHKRHVFDIALPKDRTTQTPVVIFIHGGAWVLGDKSVFASEIQQFADAGIACATMNYRYASNTSDIHHPDLPNDIKKAVDFISSKSELWQVSADNFGLVGHSAGGHLSLITSYMFNDGKIKACASWAGPVDFVDAEQLSISSSGDVFETYLGLELTSTSDTLAYKNASPFWTVNTTSIPTLLIHGTEDDGVPYSNAVKMKAKLDSLNVISSFTTLDGSGHIWTGNTLEEARLKTLNWFKENL
ncbi:MAG: alpha/beta hydrolase [Bacteroidales bacterium]|nr:alpha/beta hydrolase [Bacteroidales bacterium]